MFLDIAGPDATVLQRFYADLFGWSSAADGALSLQLRSPLPAAFRQDPAEKRIYIGVEDVAAKLAEIKAHGGSVDAPRFEVKGVAILGLFRDPAGNAMGLVEIHDGRAKVP